MNMKKYIDIVLLIALFSLEGNAVYGQKSYEKICQEVSAYYARSNDKQKIQAADFLLSNMKYHYFYDSEVLQKYYKGVDSISKKYKYPSNISNYSNLNDVLGSLEVGKKVCYDYEYISSKELISNIEAAFDSWRKGNWATHIKFDEFCEYILPYRFGTEYPEMLRNEYKDEYMPYAMKALSSDDRKYSAYWAAKSVCDGIKKKNFRLNDKAMSFSDVEMPVQVIYKMNMGQCYQLAKMTATIMRSCGIPVALDYTPQWPNRSGNHTWNSLKDNKGKNVPFVGADTYPGVIGKAEDDMPKVYRYTYAYQANSVWAIAKRYNEMIPPTLNTPFIKDVSDEYFDGTVVKVKPQKMSSEKHLVYLSVFNNQYWVPVAGKEYKGEEVSFESMGRNILYLPVFWGRNGSIPCGNPVYVSPSGEQYSFVPDHERLQTITLTRKFPVLGRMYDYAKMIVGGRLEASDDADFKTSTVLHEIDRVPQMWWNNYSVSVKKPYRYYRFSAPYNCKCNIAEMRFYDKTGREVSYVPLCDDYARNKNNVNKVNDKTYLSYYESIHFMKAWVGGDFSTPVEISRIEIMPRNDDNHVVTGHLYKLDYLENGMLVTVSVKKAVADSISFDKVPKGALMILHDLTAGMEERFFSIEGNQIHWY